MKDIVLFYAKNADGSDVFFTSLPERDDHFKIWVGESVGVLSSFASYAISNGIVLPRLRWEDNPIMIKISIIVK